MNYIPAKDADFNVFFKKICDYVTQKTGGTQPEWTHIPADAVQGLQEAYTAWETAYTKTLGDHSSQDTREKQRVRKESEGVLRQFIQNYLYDPPVSAMTGMKWTCRITTRSGRRMGSLRPVRLPSN